MEPEPQLPTDPQVLRQLVLELLSTLQEKNRRIGQLSSQLEALKRRLFGKRSEKLDSDQLLLELGAWLTSQAESCEGQAPAPVVSEEADSAPRKKGHGRSPLPKRLPRQRTEYHPVPEDCVCPECKGALRRIGEEVSEQLEYVPASLFVHEHARIKYACPDCQGHVVIGSLPLQPIAKGLPGPGLLAHVLTSKYADHLPLHRQEGMLQRHGVELSRQTLCDWVKAGAAQLKPLILVMKDEVLGSRKIHTDDTIVPVRDKHRDSMRQGRLWIYIGDAEHEHLVFDYTPDRKRDGPQRFLAGYKGYLQADAYGGYHGVYAPQGEKREPGAIEVACWAHARRKFFDAMSSDGRRAPIALAYIRELYAIEKRAHDLDVEKRHALRGQQAPQLLAAFKTWLDEEAPKVLPKSPMSEAITYARGQWDALTRYLEDGILEIDNNRAERALRRVAIGRKNWMFAGSDEGGHRAAIVYSVIASCAVLKIDPYAYLRDVLQRLPSCSPADLKSLTPKAWKAALLATKVN
jgi:transposase